ncbi:hypothetical protein ACU8NH_30485 (plasmid) [Rhizobium leguminosarum]|jgi:hypothetical protein|uniref:Uncharacterized protein n=2 Tax=Rhizobium TaxID=379 RepID=A0A179BAX1_RHILE|nr:MULTISPECIES: hypothetical protein [Rhizobium/Agrobacterium group]KAB1108748.1 hypothetical protein F4V89_28890 [Neorhizobium galegae]MCQ1775216.1 hypothetical protein [Neorhizobium galegae]MCQ1799392.1 hypothetical protein [Neorhizobium galegae]MCS0461186.1 hypothetical protein [Rhizobium favelukesii]NDK52830.1 hypothetical protein [Rhizobium laguerreae]
MRYWEACEAQVSAEDAIEECRIHEVAAAVREDDKALVDEAAGEVIAHADEEGEYYGADILGYLGY